jgi:hypothetical protein
LRTNLARSNHCCSCVCVCVCVCMCVCVCVCVCCGSTPVFWLRSSTWPVERASHTCLCVAAAASPLCGASALTNAGWLWARSVCPSQHEARTDGSGDATLATATRGRRRTTRPRRAALASHAHAVLAHNLAVRVLVNRVCLFTAHPCAAGDGGACHCATPLLARLYSNASNLSTRSDVKLAS